ncbi:type B 50S ribosomal protein L31 [Nocardioides daejeonensis]|uniref:type B 50S ribosomal protein L31 n=1 Tax=Nocardioides daejeonensis TaxID=1046556 RepID=UPI000D7405D2|nr:type B 50S ribosomal protein L31 [Nocardioides daejeonensis]
MQQDAHPAYGPVVFRDRSAGALFLTRSTIVGRLAPGHAQVVWEDGRCYPVVDVDVSSASHSFWTGRGRVLDSEGRVEAFRRRYGSATAGSTTAQPVTRTTPATGVRR